MRSSTTTEEPKDVLFTNIVVQGVVQDRSVEV